MSEYTAAYKITGWGNTPILKMEPAEDGTFNVLVSGGGGIQRFNINAAEYSRPKMLDTFDDEKHIKHDKLAANTMFVQALAKVLKKNQHVLILDSLMGLTTAMMHSLFLGAGLGNPGQYLHVPNPAFAAAAAFEATATPLCQQYGCTVFEWLRDRDHPHQTHFWLDYCCTFEGCVTQTLPKTDIKMLLHKDLLPRRQGLLGLTFSHRGVVGGSAATVQAVIHWLNHDAGPTFGYKFSLSNQMEYGKITLLLFETV